MSYTKWIGGALGWALGGPIGAIFGYAFGSIVGDTSLSIETGAYGQPQGRPGHETASPANQAAGTSRRP